MSTFSQRKLQLQLDTVRNWLYLLIIQISFLNQLFIYGRRPYKIYYFISGNWIKSSPDITNASNSLKCVDFFSPFFYYCNLLVFSHRKKCFIEKTVQIIIGSKGSSKNNLALHASVISFVFGIEYSRFMEHPLDLWSTVKNAPAESSKIFRQTGLCPTLL